MTYGTVVADQIQSSVSGVSLGAGNSTLAKRFNEAFEYRNGDIYWKINPNNISIGVLAGTAYPRGYRRVKVDGTVYAVHRVVWIMFNGDIPEGMHIDHINGNALDNSIQNLRVVSVSQNAMNRKQRKNNTGVRNVSYCKENNKYRVQVQANKKLVVFGFFDDLELAELVATEARNKYHGKYARLGV